MEVDSAPPQAGPSSSPAASTSTAPSAATATAAASETHAPSNGPNGTSQPPEGVKAENGVDQDMPDEEPEEELDENASEVIYVNNLNEKIKLNVMKQSLRTLFRQYGKVHDVVAHRNVRMRGQAFITMDDKAVAAKAVKEVKGFPLYGKPMQIAFARTASDALVKVKRPETLEEHKQERLVRKKINRKDNPLRRKHLAQKEAAKKAAETAALTGVSAPTPSTSASRRIVQMPDEYLPPNKILFVQNLPDDTTKETLESLFRPYPNLSEVRTIPGRKNIAFVEFADEASSAVARDALHNTKFGGGADGLDALRLKVTFAKQ